MSREVEDRSEQCVPVAAEIRALPRRGASAATGGEQNSGPAHVLCGH